MRLLHLDHRAPDGSFVALSCSGLIARSPSGSSTSAAVLLAAISTSLGQIPRTYSLDRKSSDQIDRRARSPELASPCGPCPSAAPSGSATALPAVISVVTVTIIPAAICI
ncbi:hypothetical protein E2562_009536 [Oryza meyeriana var. granulata]|uniref:Uncharacterized protein n=1 Tax=Oryza meyeriana var. granulata TaxID=110450 RepID=A0A6G1F608_9ORYZ|nr:hypothetical protein E2562_009536 [Oryza meyeriana var. granulata]